MAKHHQSTILWMIILLNASWLSGCGRDGLQYQPLPANATILAFGDSVTHGTGAGSGEDYPSILARETGWRVINAGVPGDTANRAKDRIAPLLTEFEPDLVLISLGGNDFLRRRDDSAVKEDLRAIVARVRLAGPIPVLIAVPTLSPMRASFGTLKDAPLYRELAHEEELLLIEDIFADVLSTANLRSDPIHPNAEGYRHFAAGVLKTLETAGLISTE